MGKLGCGDLMSYCMIALPLLYRAAFADLLVTKDGWSLMPTNFDYVATPTIGSGQLTEDYWTSLLDAPKRARDDAVKPNLRKKPTNAKQKPPLKKISLAKVNASRPLKVKAAGQTTPAPAPKPLLGQLVKNMGFARWGQKLADPEDILPEYLSNPNEIDFTNGIGQMHNVLTNEDPIAVLQDATASFDPWIGEINRIDAVKRYYEEKRQQQRLLTEQSISQAT